MITAMSFHKSGFCFISTVTLLCISIISYLAFDRLLRNELNGSSHMEVLELPEIELRDYELLSKSIKAKHMTRVTQCDWREKNNNDTNSTCTFSTIQTYMDECGFFPSELTLDIYDVPVYEHCHLPVLPQEDIFNHFHSRIDRIIVTGDSQGVGYAGAVLGEFKRRGILCELLRQEPNGYYSTKSFFWDAPESLAAMMDAPRTCTGCTSFIRSCVIPPTQTFPQSKIIHFESLGIVWNKIDGIVVNQTYCEQHPTNFECGLTTLSDVIFKHHLKSNSSDVLIMIPTFAHDLSFPYNIFLPKLRSMMAVMHQHLNSRSHVIWMPSTTINLHTHKDISSFMNVNETQANQRTEVLNHWLFELIQSYKDKEEGPTFHGFFYVGEIGRLKEVDWAHDIFHYEHIFYQTVISMLFSLLPGM